MPFFARAFLSPIYILACIVLELWLRRQKSMQPSSWSQLRPYLSRKSAPDKRWVALIFALVSLVLFAFWEALLAHMLGRRFGLLSWSLATALWFVYLWMRKAALKADEPRGVNRWEVMIFALSMVFYFESILAAFLSVWVFFRAKFLTLKKNALD